MGNKRTETYEALTARPACEARGEGANAKAGGQEADVRAARKPARRGLTALMMTVMMVVMVAVMGISLTGCGALGDAAGDLADEISQLADDLEDTTYFNNYTSEEKDGEYVMKGQVHYAAADDDDACAVWIHAAQDTEVHVTGVFEKKKNGEGALKLVYIDPDGGRTTLADEETGEIDLTIKVKKGDGLIRFEGEDAVYNFELHFSKAKGVAYDWSGDEMEDRMDEFEEDMEDIVDDLEDQDE